MTNFSIPPAGGPAPRFAPGFFFFPSALSLVFFAVVAVEVEAPLALVEEALDDDALDVDADVDVDADEEDVDDEVFAEEEEA